MTACLPSIATTALHSGTRPWSVCPDWAGNRSWANRLFEVFPSLGAVDDSQNLLSVLDGSGVLARPRSFAVNGNGHTVMLENAYTPLYDRSSAIAGGAVVARECRRAVPATELRQHHKARANHMGWPTLCRGR